MKRILVIEDEPSVRNNLVKLLTAESFEVFWAENGSRGIHLANEQMPDLILCDIMMPEMSGYDVLEVLRSDEITSTIPFIFLTAKADRSDLRQGMLLGADDYLTKPFTRAELLGAIATRLSKHDAVTQRYAVALKNAAEQLNRLAYYDSVTDLPNRLLLRERFNQILHADEASTSLGKEKNTPVVTILSIGFDRFNWIDRNLGFTFGDLLLRAIAKRLSECMGERNTVARLDGQQFVTILATATSKQEVVRIAQTILDRLSQSFKLHTYEVFVTPSLGIAFFGSDGKTIESLVRNAESARCEAQERGGNCYQFYQGKNDAPSDVAVVLEASLRHALEREEFELYYQPKVNLKTGYITGAEALVRWHHPQRGLVSPGEFMPLAEKTGLIIPLDEWVMKTACQQVQAWQRAAVPPVPVAVNLSGRQFNQPGLTQRVSQILEQTGLEAKYLEIELTESTLVQNIAAAIATLNEVKSLGIRIAIDDFGTGYSSLGYLKQFPFDTLKIDRCFVRNVTSDAKNAAIAIAIIQMAQGLNLKVVAEGVETEAEQAFLYENQCDEIQGYLFSPPVPAEVFSKLLHSTNSLQIEK